MLLLGDPVLAALALPARWAGVPVAVVVHGLDIDWPHRGYRAYLRRFFWNRCDVYFCISRYVRDRLGEGGVDPARCALVHPGVAATAPSPRVPPAAEPRLLILGRLVRRKGALWFGDHVMPKLRADPRGIVLDIVGEGPDRAAIERAIEREGLHARVRLWGEVDDAEKARRLDACDLALMPNRRVPGDPEGFGLVALEAAMSGRYVLAADLEGLRDALADPALGRLLPELADRTCGPRRSSNCSPIARAARARPRRARACRRALHLARHGATLRRTARCVRLSRRPADGGAPRAAAAPPAGCSAWPRWPWSRSKPGRGARSGSRCGNAWTRPTSPWRWRCAWRCSSPSAWPGIYSRTAAGCARRRMPICCAGARACRPSTCPARSGRAWRAARCTPANAAPR
ncbi:glycosyltransferase family 4 protein [Lysobacter enzymogenes]|nr:glycosyltransferase family 4 protein [Lysobacter enzymogenes]QCW24897.1 glycosyltransferase family 4 protein [Lysobacter enzymogenes]